MAASGITVLVCDGDWRAIAQPVAGWVAIHAERKHNAAGVGEMTVPGITELLVALDTPDSRIVVQVDGEIWTSGPVDRPGGQAWTPADGTGLVTVNFSTCEAFLTERLTYPNPAQTASTQTSVAYAVTATNAETVCRNLVNLNAGPGALAARQIPGLTLGAVAGIGTNIDLTTRFEVLTDVLRAAASAGGSFTWQVRQSGTGLVFECLPVMDRSGWVRFSRTLGTLREFQTDPEAPTCTVALVGDDGTGTGRVIAERSNASAIAAGYRRIEKWVNNGDGTAAELNNAGDLALLDGAPRVGLVAKVVDSPQIRFGVDYFLGDTVAVDVVPGVAVYDQVKAVTLDATPDTGYVVSPTIGGGEYLATAFVEREIRELRRRLSLLERN